jgi:MFS family permease
MAWTAFPIFATVGPSAAFGLSGHERSVGIMVALYGLAEAGGALIAGRVMDRLGRRVGLAAGYALLAVGGGRAAWILQSRANWLCISQLCVPLGEQVLIAISKIFSSSLAYQSPTRQVTNVRLSARW